MTSVLLVPSDRAHPRALAVLTDRVCRVPAGADDADGPTTVPTIVRVVRMDAEATVIDRHLRVDAAAARPWRMAADVLLASGGPQRASALARHHPGALVVAAYSGSRCWMRLGMGERTLLRTHKQRSAPDEASLRRDPVWPVWASAVHAWLVAGLSFRALARSSAYLLWPPGETGTIIRRQVSLDSR